MATSRERIILTFVEQNGVLKLTSSLTGSLSTLAFL